MLQIGSHQTLLSHNRFRIVLRNESNDYADIILFRLASSPSSASPSYYAMQASCPHMGADMTLGDIEEVESVQDEEHDCDRVLVCPWHSYDFNLRTGESQMSGLNACIYQVQVRPDAATGVECVYIEPPSRDPHWKLVSIKGVSQAFAPDPLTGSDKLEIEPPSQPEPIIPSPPPKTLIQWAILILKTPDPVLKVARTRHASTHFLSGSLTRIGVSTSISDLPLVPPRSETPYTPNKQTWAGHPTLRGKKARLSALHALATIEQWAIDLAWDIIARYSIEAQDEHSLPVAFYRDFVQVAQDEAKHFSLLNNRIIDLSDGLVKYGDGTFPCRAELWESAVDTKDSLLSRLAIIHMVHEARGLDVNPSTIERFRRSGDLASVQVLQIIHNDEVTHVTAGHRWFTYICARTSPPVQPIPRFREEVRRHWKGDIKGPFNEKDRATAGLEKDFYVDLRGEKNKNKEHGIESG